MVIKILGFILIFFLAVVANRLSDIHPAVEFPIWAVILGLVVGNIPRLSTYLRSVAHTEFFIKVGLILLGASINFGVILAIGIRGLIQALVGIPLIFFATWYFAKWLGIDEKMRALLASAISICGVSAAIAAAGAVVAKKEQLTYVVILVIAFALPLMLIIPVLAQVMNLPPAVAGAWIGNNIDTTAAVIGAGAIHGEEALKVASVVKMAQNTFIGFVAFLLALYFTIKTSNQKKPKPIELWHRFPKFVLAFVIVSLMATIGLIDPSQEKALKALRKWFFCLAFVCIGLGFSLREIRGLGGRPILVFAFITALNTATALGLSWLLFSDYEVE